MTLDGDDIDSDDNLIEFIPPIMPSTQAEFTLRTLDTFVDPQVDTDRNMQLTVKY